MNQLELNDFDIDHQLLQLPGTSLLIFTGAGCASCRYARQVLPRLQLAIDRLCWIDAQENGGAVARYEVSHLPTMFVVHDGRFHGSLRTPLTRSAIELGLAEALATQPDELP